MMAIRMTPAAALPQRAAIPTLKHCSSNSSPSSKATMAPRQFVNGYLVHDHNPGCHHGRAGTVGSDQTLADLLTQILAKIKPQNGYAQDGTSNAASGPMRLSFRRWRKKNAARGSGRRIMNASSRAWTSRDTAGDRYFFAVGHHHGCGRQLPSALVFLCGPSSRCEAPDPQELHGGSRFSKELSVSRKTLCLPATVKDNVIARRFHPIDLGNWHDELVLAQTHNEAFQIGQEAVIQTVGWHDPFLQSSAGAGYSLMESRRLEGFRR